MSFAPDITELLARARADLRMGVPVVLEGAGAALILAAETLSDQRLRDVLALGGAPVLAITARRAETLKARVYDRDLARILLPPDATPAWVQSIADPADDLRAPMKGPFTCARGGETAIHRAALQLAKTARLLPAVLVLSLTDGNSFAQDNGLTLLPLNRAEAALARRFT